MNGNELYPELERLIKESEEESVQELKAIAEETELSMAAEEAGDHIQNLKSLGLNTAFIEEQERKDVEESYRLISEVDPNVILGGGEAEIAKRLAMDEMMESRELSLVPEGAALIPPIVTSQISSEDLTPQAWVRRPQCHDVAVRASGSGWGCVGGRRSHDRHIYFWFAYRPPANRHYSIKPYVNFHGYYELYANDKWHNCKYADVSINMSIRAYQYNWKDEMTFSVFSRGDDNINFTGSNARRMDKQHFTQNYTALLGRGDNVWIRVKVHLHAYGKGGGSYGKLDFSTGAANYVCSKYCFIG